MIASGESPRRVLIIKPSSLGDVVTAVPVMRSLRRTFPQAHIAWLLGDSCAALLADDDDLDEVILFERKRLGRAWRSAPASLAIAGLVRTLRKGRFDWTIDLQGLLRSGLLTAATRASVRAGFADAREGAWLFYSHRIRTTPAHIVDRNIDLARQLGLDAGPEDFTLQVSAQGRQYVEAFRRRTSIGSGEFLICVPPTRWPTKVYPIRHWRKAIAELCKTIPVVLLGSAAADEMAMCEAIAVSTPAGVINLAGKTSLPEMVAMIAASAVVICSDSAAQYIAPAVGVNAITLVGPTRPQRTGPYRLGRCIIADVPCQGCLKRSCGHVTCMESIDPAAVVSAAMDVLRQRSPICRYASSPKK